MNEPCGTGGFSPAQRVRCVGSPDLLLAHPEVLPYIGSCKVTECQAFPVMHL